jgi:CRP/FNR family transcriptional regulator
MKTPAELLQECPFFAGLDDETYSALLVGAQLRHYPRNSTLFLEGEAAKGLFLLQAGLVKIYTLSESGREQIVELQRPGDSVAELPLFDNGPYPASAAAMEASDVLFIPKAVFLNELAHHAELGQAVIAALARRMRKLVLLIQDLSLRQVRQRLARFLLEEAAGRSAFLLNFTNDELAARLGSVRDVVSRSLSALQNDGFIKLNGRQVTILDSVALADC